MSSISVSPRLDGTSVRAPASYVRFPSPVGAPAWGLRVAITGCKKVPVLTFERRRCIMGKSYGYMIAKLLLFAAERRRGKTPWPRQA